MTSLIHKMSMMNALRTRKAAEDTPAKKPGYLIGQFQPDAKPHKDDDFLSVVYWYQMMFPAYRLI